MELCLQEKAELVAKASKQSSTDLPMGAVWQLLYTAAFLLTYAPAPIVDKPTIRTNTELSILPPDEPELAICLAIWSSRGTRHRWNKLPKGTQFVNTHTHTNRIVNTCL